MNKTLRNNFDIEVAFASALKQKGHSQRRAQQSAQPFSVGSQSMEHEQDALSRLFQRVLDFLYEMIKPLLRPLASEIRRYLTDQIRQEIYSSQQRTVELLRQSIRESLEENEKAVQKVASRNVSGPGHDAGPTVTVGGSAPCSALEPSLAACLHEAREQGAGLRRLLQRLLLPGDCFVDICECIGVHTVAAAHAVRGTGMVVSFSPLSFRKALRHAAAAQEGGHAEESPNTAKEPAAAVFTCGCSVVPAQRCGLTLQAALPSGSHVRVVHIDAAELIFDILEGSPAFVAEHPDLALVIKLDPSRLQRPGKSADEVLGLIRSLGLVGREVDHVTGMLGEAPMERLTGADTVHAIFARPGSPLWAMAEFRQ